MMARDALHPHLRDGYRWWWSITTRWSDNDAYRQVNNAIYYLWFDIVVDAWLIESELLDVSTGDPIEIALAIERQGTSSVTYRSGAFQPEVAAQASFVHVYIDRAKRRPVSLPAP